MILHWLANTWRPILEISVMALFFYYIFLFIQGTRAVQILFGLFLIVSFFFLIQILKLDSLNWLISRIFPVAILSLLIIFQPELRRGLARLGGKPFMSFLSGEENVINIVSESAMVLSKKRIGGLIALEAEIGLKNYIESGIKLDARVSTELIVTIFTDKTPLHDGGVVIEGGMIAAAAYLFPLTQLPKIAKTMGTRHRAAIGLSEETDAVVVVVSEETGSIAIAHQGNIIPDLDEVRLKRILRNVLVVTKEKKSFFQRLVSSK